MALKLSQKIKFTGGKNAPEGIEKFGKDFWQDALDYPMTWFIECLK